MRYLSRPSALRPQRGSVAIEAAVTITFILIPVLAFILFFGRYFWYYTIVQKAAHDATLYFAAAQLPDIRNNSAGTLAQDIIREGLADIDSTTMSTKGVDTYCLYPTVANPGALTPRVCTLTTPPAAVKTSIFMTVKDPFLAPMTGPIIGYDGLPISAETTLPYVGR